MNDLFTANATDILTRFNLADHPAFEEEARFICTAPIHHLFSRHDAGFMSIAETYAIAERRDNRPEGQNWIVYEVSVTNGHPFVTMQPKLYGTDTVLPALKATEARRPYYDNIYGTRGYTQPMPSESVARHYSQFETIDAEGRPILRHKNYTASMPR